MLRNVPSKNRNQGENMKKTVLILALMIITLSLYGCGNSEAVDNAFQEGYEYGYNEGYEYGYGKGYDNGLSDGEGKYFDSLDEEMRYSARLEDYLEFYENLICLTVDGDNTYHGYWHVEEMDYSILEKDVAESKGYTPCEKCYIDTGFNPQ